MADYDFWVALFTTWQSTSDWIKALLIITPPGFVMGVLALLLRHRVPNPQQSGRSHQNAVIPPEPFREITHRITLDSLSESPEYAAVLRPEADKNKMLEYLMSISDTDTRAQVRQIVIEEYSRNSHPSKALQRVRQFLADQNRGGP